MPIRSYHGRPLLLETSWEHRTRRSRSSGVIPDRPSDSRQQAGRGGQDRQAGVDREAPPACWEVGRQGGADSGGTVPQRLMYSELQIQMGGPLPLHSSLEGTSAALTTFILPTEGYPLKGTIIFMGFAARSPGRP